MKLSLAMLCTFAICGTSLAQQPREKPKELEALGRYVGDWTTDVTSKPAEWTPHEIKYRCANHAELIFNGWFLQHIEVNQVVGEPDQVTKAIWFQTFDATSKKYVTWFFQSSGNISHSTGTWDAASKTFTHTDVEPPPGTTNRFAERFLDGGGIDGSLVFTCNDGQMMFDMAWTRKRQAGIAGKRLLEHWSEIGSPIRPIPDEVKNLDVFLGEKDVELVHRPSIVVPQGSTAIGSASGRWILDGRFLLGETKLPDFESLWIMGYDSNRKAYHYVLFGSDGRVEENIGQWNETERVFDWTQVNGPPDLTRTSTTRRLDDGSIESHIITKSQDGITHMDLTIRADAKNELDANELGAAVPNKSWGTRPITPEMAARYEARLAQRVMETMGLLLLTWLPLQIGAIWIAKHPLARIGAGLAIIPILPILITGAQTKTYRDGSLFGIAFMAIYVPVMIYLALFFFAGLAARAAKKSAPESAPTETENNAAKRLPVVLLTLAVLFGLGVLLCFLVLVPR